jgi:WD40 repeat protein
MPGAGPGDDIYALRSRALAGDLKGAKIPRLVWGIEQGATVEKTGDRTAGGPGGYVILSNVDGSRVKTRKVDPFAVTGLGFSTDGDWIATASASGAMRLLRRSEFLSSNDVKDRILQFGNAFKLFVFLAVHRYMAEYPIREFAVSVDPRAGRHSEKKDVTVLALTESGRLLRWSNPGPIGKQIGSLDKLSVGTASGGSITFSAIATNPANQKVWAATGTVIGIVRDLVFVEQRDTRPPPEESAGPHANPGISAMSWNQAGDTMALGLRDGTILIYGGNDIAKIVSLAAHSAEITTLSWHGDTLASGSIDGSAALWKLHFTPQDRDMLHNLALKASEPLDSLSSYDAVNLWIKARLSMLQSTPR